MAVDEDRTWSGLTAWQGYNAGEVASGMATHSSRPNSAAGRGVRQRLRHRVRRAMDICVDNANRAIFNAANSNPQYAGMGTTLVVGVFRDAAC